MILPEKMNDTSLALTSEQEAIKTFILNEGQELNRFMLFEMMNQVREGKQVDLDARLGHKFNYTKVNGEFNWERSANGAIVARLNKRIYLLQKIGTGDIYYLDKDTCKLTCVPIDQLDVFSQQAKSGELCPLIAMDAELSLTVVEGKVIPNVTQMTMYSFTKDLESLQRVGKAPQDFTVLDRVASDVEDSESNSNDESHHTFLGCRNL